VYSLSFGGHLERFDGTATSGVWTPLAEFPSTADYLLWLGPGSTLILNCPTHPDGGCIDPDVRTLIDGEPGVESVGDGREFRFIDWTRTNIGPVAAFAPSVIELEAQLRQADGRWVLLEESLSTQPAHAIAGLREGFIFSGDFGYITQYNNGRYCESIPGVAPGMDVFHITPIGPSTFVVSGKATVSETGARTPVFVIEAVTAAR
jgi:hypothetical protein